MGIGLLQKLIKKEQWQTDHVVGYEETISLAEEPSTSTCMWLVWKSHAAGIIHFDDVFKNMCIWKCKIL